MTPGIPNPNAIGILQRMSIVIIADGKEEAMTVMYNPESVTHSRSVDFSKQNGVATNAPVTQFAGGGLETVKFRLLFDTFSAGPEASYDKWADKGLSALNMVAPSAGKFMDVREYTQKIRNLMEIMPSQHVPPLVRLKWSSLQFEGHLTDCNVSYVKFNEFGKAVRAWMDCTFQQYVQSGKVNEPGKESPDTTKYRTIYQGDSLWRLSDREYNNPGRWRYIAEANGLSNPRVLQTGDLLSVPALK